MDSTKPGLPLLEQREIEAKIVGPLVRAFAAELGQERALAIVSQVIRELARQSGGELAQVLGEQTLEAFAKTLGRWCENGALEIDVLEQSPEKLSFNVTRCRYAEMYRALGLADLGGEPVVPARLCPGSGFQPGDPARSERRRSWKVLRTATSVSVATIPRLSAATTSQQTAPDTKPPGGDQSRRNERDRWVTCRPISESSVRHEPLVVRRRHGMGTSDPAPEPTGFAASCPGKRSPCASG